MPFRSLVDDQAAGEPAAASVRPAPPAAMPAPGRAGARQWYALAVLVLGFVANLSAMVTIDALIEPIKHSLALGDGEMGLIAGFIYACGYVVLAIPVGLMSDRFSRRNITAVAMSLAGLCSILCGSATGFAGLIAARAGVGAAQTGGNPTAIALIPDLFPPSQRATAMGIYFLGTPIGLMVLFPVASAIAAHHGWRMALVAAGLPSLAVSLLLLLTVREPRRGATEHHAESAGAPPIPLRTTLRFILSQRTIPFCLAAISLSNLTSAAGISWFGSFFVRDHQMPVQDIGMVFALGFGLAGGIGNLFGGIVSDRLARRDPRWRIRVTTLATLGVLVFGEAAVAVPTLGEAIAALCLWSLCINVQFGPIYGLCQGLVQPRMRGVMSAILSMLGMIIGYGLGSQITGLLSQGLTPAFGADAVRYALAIVGALNIAVALFYMIATRFLEDGLRRIG